MSSGLSTVPNNLVADFQNNAHLDWLMNVFDGNGALVQIRRGSITLAGFV